MDENGSRPQLHDPGASGSGGGSSDGSSWGTEYLEAGKSEIWFSGGGGGYNGDLKNLISPESLIKPAAYAADLYVNGVKAEELTLLPVEGGGAS